MPRGVIDAARDAVGASHGHGPGLADSTRAYSVCRVSVFVGHASSGPLNGTGRALSFRFRSLRIEIPHRASSRVSRRVCAFIVAFLFALAGGVGAMAETGIPS
jgi:hypothetical protein